MRSQRAGWMARVTSSVGSCRSLRTSSSVIARVFCRKPSTTGGGTGRRSAAKLAEAAGGAPSKGGCTISCLRFRGIPGEMDENVAEGHVDPGYLSFELVRSAESDRLSSMHNGDPVTEPIRLLHVVSCQDYGRSGAAPKLFD